MDNSLKYVDYFCVTGSFSGISYSSGNYTKDKEIRVIFEGTVDDCIPLENCKIHIELLFSAKPLTPAKWATSEINNFARYDYEYDAKTNNILETKCFYITLFENISDFERFIEIFNINKNCLIEISLQHTNEVFFQNIIYENRNEIENNIENSIFSYINFDEENIADKYFPVNWYKIIPINKEENVDNGYDIDSGYKSGYNNFVENLREKENVNYIVFCSLSVIVLIISIIFNKELGGWWTLPFLFLVYYIGDYLRVILHNQNIIRFFCYEYLKLMIKVENKIKR